MLIRVRRVCSLAKRESHQGDAPTSLSVASSHPSRISGRGDGSDSGGGGDGSDGGGGDGDGALAAPPTAILLTWQAASGHANHGRSLSF